MSVCLKTASPFFNIDGSVLALHVVPGDILSQNGKKQHLNSVQHQDQTDQKKDNVPVALWQEITGEEKAEKRHQRSDEKQGACRSRKRCRSGREGEDPVQSIAKKGTETPFGSK